MWGGRAAAKWCSVRFLNTGDIPVCMVDAVGRQSREENEKAVAASRREGETGRVERQVGEQRRGRLVSLRVLCAALC